ncbi:MAG: zinc ribbon domain-containing protein [Candidatus Heimdallarchaeota archaeon]|nr:zinc ribbon domain-containing protein [Candidatus Heimdallarchaeota archaeon]
MRTKAFLFMISFVLIIGNGNSSYVLADQNVHLNLAKYRFTGYIAENGDNRWDSNEYDFFTFKVYANEKLEVELSLAQNEIVYLMFFTGYSVEGIEDAMSDLQYYGSSAMIYASDITNNGFARISYTAPQETIGRIAIFSYSTISYSSIQYTMRSSIPEGSSRNNRGLDYINTNSQTSIDDDGADSSVIIIFIVILAVFLIIRSRNKKKNKRHGYSQDSGSIISSQGIFQPQSMYGANFYQDSPKSMGYDRFCTGCGDGIRLSQKYCTNCGSQ